MVRNTKKPYIEAMRKLYLFTVCLFLGLVPGVDAQPVTETDTLWVSSLEVRTFVIRKHEEETVQPPLATSEETQGRSPKAKKDSATVPPKRALHLMPPSVASDELGLFKMFYLEPFNSQAQLPGDMNYVVFAFTIDEYGYLSKFRVYDTNDRRLVDVLVTKLGKTRWNPAQQISGERQAYDFKKWIAIIPAKTKDEDYERHRY